MARQKKPSTPDATPAWFNAKDAQRIANAVHAHETSRRVPNPSVLPRVNGSGGGGGVVEAHYTGGWLKGSVKQITFAANTSATASAINLLRSIPIASAGGSRLCVVAPRSTPPDSSGSQQFVLINSEC